jgi:peptidoglycan/LPS O-acetylase OafA/YrhL
MNKAHVPASGYFFPFLDGMRGIAILSVVIFHTVYFNPSTTLGVMANSLVSTGGFGVPIFFTLSGFLISLAVFTAKNPFDVYGYACRRAAKIAPPFLLSLVLFAAADWWMNGGAGWLKAFVYDVTTLNHFLKGPTLNGVYWSLFIEIHFYIVLPFVYLSLMRVTRFARLYTCGIFLVIPVLFRLYDYRSVQTIDLLVWGLGNFFPRIRSFCRWHVSCRSIYQSRQECNGDSMESFSRHFRNGSARCDLFPVRRIKL